MLRSEPCDSVCDTVKLYLDVSFELETVEHEAQADARKPGIHLFSILLFV